jgi:hypothetical protein
MSGSNLMIACLPAWDARGIYVIWTSVQMAICLRQQGDLANLSEYGKWIINMGSGLASKRKGKSRPSYGLDGRKR